MKSTLKRLFASYFSSMWRPSIIYMEILLLLTLAGLFRLRWIHVVSNILFLLLIIAFFGVFASAIWNLFKKRWAKGLGNLVMLFVCVVAFYFYIFLLMLSSLLEPSEDGFADNLEIPTDMEIIDPIPELDNTPENKKDAFQEALFSALSKPGGNDPTITGNVDSLVALYRKNPGILRRYLASSPAWRVFEDRGNVFATRRWKVSSQWKYDLHGYYSGHDIDFRNGSEILGFQSRFTIGLSGKPWARKGWGSTRLKAGETVIAKISPGNGMDESHLVISADSLVVEIFEQSGKPERRLTKAALDFLEQELKPLAENPEWETVLKILPPGSLKKGEPSLEIRNSFQPGIYDSFLWLNPGEPGMVYIKAFEVTKGTPLSVFRLRNRSNEWIGWSDNPEELFFSNTHFTIFEGDWGKPYAARLEVWFKPDGKGPERKLLERIFKIQGWQR